MQSYRIELLIYTHFKTGLKPSCGVNATKICNNQICNNQICNNQICNHRNQRVLNQFLRNA